MIHSSMILMKFVALSPIRAFSLRTVLPENPPEPAHAQRTTHPMYRPEPAPSTSGRDIWELEPDVRVNKKHPHFLNYSRYEAEHPYTRPPRGAFCEASESEFLASARSHRSVISDHHLFSICHKYRVPRDVHFHKLTKVERADQPPLGMIMINEYVLEIRLHFPLHVTICQTSGVLS